MAETTPVVAVTLSVIQVKAALHALAMTAGLDDTPLSRQLTDAYNAIRDAARQAGISV